MIADPAISVMEMLTVGLMAALGTAIGALLRFEISRRLIQRLGDVFPWATLGINLAGCLLAGLLFAFFGSSAGLAKVFFSIGVLGGFTTVSSFSLETVLMIQRGHWNSALVYAAASLVGGVAAAGLGIVLARIAGL